ncbi:MAG: hypothetical protein KKH72_05095 [Alphaproteobacteria bacterium]|nr:hypothetical protein [Alphaproteobacteria bacterium]
MWIPPLLILPLIVYNILVFFFFGSIEGGWATPILEVPMVSGTAWTLSLSDTFLVVTLFLLFVEVLKSTRTDAGSMFEHMASTLVFVAFLVEFLVVAKASTSLFFLCTVMSFIDVVAGFSVSMRAARRDFGAG